MRTIKSIKKINTKRPMPKDFVIRAGEFRAKHITKTALRQMYGVGYHTINRWLDELTAAKKKKAIEANINPWFRNVNKHNAINRIPKMVPIASCDFPIDEIKPKRETSNKKIIVNFPNWGNVHEKCEACNNKNCSNKKGDK